MSTSPPGGDTRPRDAGRASAGQSAAAWRDPRVHLVSRASCRGRWLSGAGTHKLTPLRARGMLPVGRTGRLQSAGRTESTWAGLRCTRFMRTSYRPTRADPGHSPRRLVMPARPFLLGRTWTNSSTKRKTCCEPFATAFPRQLPTSGNTIPSASRLPARSSPLLSSSSLEVQRIQLDAVGCGLRTNRRDPT